METEHARIKLTFLYTLIVAGISIFLSVFIFFILSNQLDRGLKPPNGKAGEKWQLLVEKDLEEQLVFTKRRLFISLAIINGGIIIITAGASYYISGNTLGPLERSLDEQKRFISDASHEIRTPLTALKTAIEVNLRDKKLSKETKTILKENLEDVKSLETLSENLLRLSRLQQHAQKGHTKLNLGPIVERAVKTLKPLAKNKQIKIKYRKPKKKIRLSGNKQDIAELILILGDNAIKYSNKKTKITVSLKKSGGSAVIQVKDCGIGIRQTEIPYLFNRFYRADSSRTTQNVKGHGLGLSIAKEIVDHHGGKIKVKSKFGEGSVFSVYLPLNL